VLTRYFSGPLLTLTLDNRKMTDLTYCSPKTKVRNSSIHGKGLFARAPIVQGEIVAVKGGYILNQQQWAAVELEFWAAEIQISEELFIAPLHKDQRWSHAVDQSFLRSEHSPTRPNRVGCHEGYYGK
jgi:hypothetical protein